MFFDISLWKFSVDLKRNFEKIFQISQRQVEFVFVFAIAYSLEGLADHRDDLLLISRAAGAATDNERLMSPRRHRMRVSMEELSGQSWDELRAATGLVRTNMLYAPDASS